MTSVFGTPRRGGAGRWPLFGLTLATLIAGPALAGTAASAGGGSASTAPALPTGGVVQAGSASIGAASGSSLTVTQTSSRAIINWSGFSVGLGGTVQFNNGSGATLNRVTGSSVSAIDGLLSGTGSVYLINPNGVIVGKDGVVNVGGTFAASTLDVANSNFMGGGSLTFSGSSTATVINEGKIGALGGDVALIAAKVENDGSITAANGDVGLAAGYQVVLTDSTLDDGKFQVLVGGSDTSATNTGAITAAEAELRANGGNVYALAGNTSSIIKATGVSANDGKVFLIAEGGATTAQGEIDATRSVETSGQTVDFSGVTIKSASWLIDPDDLTIGSGDVGAIDAALNGGANVTLQTTSGASSTSPGSYGTDTPGGAGDITIAAAISWSGAGDLVLDSYHSIHIDAAITTLGGEVDLITADDGEDGPGAGPEGGALDFGLTKSGFSGSISFTGGPGADGVLTVNGAPYTLIYSMAELDAIDGTSAVDGASVTQYGSGLGGDYALAGDLDASAVTYAGALVGSNTSPFSGLFEGLGHTVTGLTISAGSANFVGLFGMTASGSLVENIALSGDNVSSAGYSTGALVGLAGGGVANASAAGSVSGNQSVGGLVGTLEGDIQGSHSAGVVSGQTSVGGLVGEADSNPAGSISQSYATANVSGTQIVGGLVGWFASAGSITDSYATGAVSGQNTVGGLVGLASASFTPSSTFAAAEISRSWASGAVTVLSGGQNAGGLIGEAGGADVTDSYATGAVLGSFDVGGLIGTMNGDDDGDVTLYSTVQTSYSTGVVTGQNNVGGLIGSNANGTVTTSYWDTSTSGRTTSSGGTGQTTAQLQGVLPSGFGSAAWSTGAALYPYLNSSFPGGVQAISGIAYTDAGLTPAASGANGLVTVTGIGGGAMLGSATTGANGYYYIFGPAGTFTSGQTLLAVDSLDGATLGTTTAALNQTGGTIYGAAVTVPTTQTLLSAAPTLNQAEASAVLADGGDAAVTALIDAATGRGFIATGASFTVDQTVSAASTFYVSTGSGEALTVIDPITPSAGGSVGLISGGTLNIDAAISVTGAGSANLAYNTAAVTNLSFDLTGAGFLGSLTFAPGYSQTLDVNSAAYTLLYTVAAVQALNAGSAALQGHYALAGSLDAGAFAGWVPIGMNAAGATLNGGYGFSGVFTGLGHTVSNLSVNAGANANSGAFGLSYGTLRDVGLLGGAVTATGTSAARWIGGLIGLNHGTLDDDFTTIAVTLSGGAISPGGLAGNNNGQIFDSFATGVVTDNGGNQAGGLVGTNQGTITDAYATGAVSGYDYVGGLVGLNYSGTINGAYATGSATGYLAVGGLAGGNQAALTNVYATGAAIGSGYLGGVTGYVLTGSSITNGYYDAATTGQGLGARTNGSVGMTTAALQGTLPTGFAASGLWTTGTGLYPYLTNFFPSGVQAISGTAYSSAGVDAVGAQIAIYSGGASIGLGTASSGANGYFYQLVPTGTLASIGVELGETITLAGASAASGMHYADNLAFTGAAGAQLLSGNPVTSGLQLEQTRETDLTALAADVSATFGAGEVAALNTALSAARFVVQSSGAQFTVDESLSRAAIEIESSGNLTIGEGETISSSAAGDAIILSANGNFINDDGAGALSASGGGRWLIYSQLHGSSGAAPTGDVFGGLTAKNYFGDAFSFGAGAPGTFALEPTSGDRFVYGYQPTITVTADTKSAPYDGAVQTDSYTVSGYITGDSGANAFQGPVTGLTTSSKQVGMYTLTPAGGSSDENYAINYASGVLTITPITLTVGLTGTVVKPYDGTATATLAPANYLVSGLQPGDAGVATLSNPILGSYATKNQGSGILVTVNAVLKLSGADAIDYTVANPGKGSSNGRYSLTLTGNVGQITPLTLSASLVGNVTKTYDGTNAANLAAGNYHLGGTVIAGDNIGLNDPTSGTYNDANAGTGKLVTVTGVSLTNNPYGDYVLASSTISASIGVINPKVLTASLVGPISKTYDGTTTAYLTATNYGLSGIVSVDIGNVGLSNPTTGTYATAGSSKATTNNIVVTVKGLALVGSAAHNYVLASTTITGALGTIFAPR